MTTRILTGITPSGVPHLGNYAGAIRPAIRSQTGHSSDNFYFIADLHSLIKAHDPVQRQRSTLEVAATWIACGLDPDGVTFYRQSDIPEIPELAWYLTVVAGKGLLNRAHAYKAAVDRNNEAGLEPDADITAGLFMYPVLMAADIMAFKAGRVPVGRDQIQHIEMARDMAASFNHLYGNGQELLLPPQALVDEQVATLPGLDGRKMSKSYGNTIPLFVPREQLRRLIMGIETDSLAPGQPKATEGSAVFQIFQAFATPQETEEMRAAFAGGIAWGEAKQRLFERIDVELAPMRERFRSLMAEPERIEEILRNGATQARAVARPFLAQLRSAVGLCSLAQPLQRAHQQPQGGAGTAPAQIKQYREADGQFYFKLVGDRGEVLLQSLAFASGREAGAAVALLRSSGLQALPGLAQVLAPHDPDSPALGQALQALQEQSGSPGTVTQSP